MLGGIKSIDAVTELLCAFLLLHKDLARVCFDGRDMPTGSWTEIRLASVSPLIALLIYVSRDLLEILWRVSVRQTERMGCLCI
jgi:hypothetical protein